ncbi:hypothetical protein [Sphingosinicella sp. BN140058]|uniref:hypothetical protein n=1 Tax=Sphingosinicella sp. BN140058 TaxID=1892855 RepID=UPI0010118CA7|nr:hypothetical protein [Sphingosinicella sp. BN140058]QAY80218.1 hypothetical protein ETR14_26610 [Sphingosinicella sp. BN140058]
MLKSPILKYVASPQTVAYMPPLLAGCSIGGGMFLWFFGMAAGFGIIPGMIVLLTASAFSVVAGFKEPHLHNILIARQAFMKATPNIVKTKGKTYVG